MANCPKCAENIQWDWCGDAFVYEKTGKPLKTLQVNSNKRDFTGEHVICDCKKWIGTVLDTPGNITIVDCPEWRYIDWEEKDNRYGG